MVPLSRKCQSFHTMRMWQEGRQMADTCHPIRAIRNEMPFVAVEPQGPSTSQGACGVRQLTRAQAPSVRSQGSRVGTAWLMRWIDSKGKRHLQESNVKYQL